MGCVAGAQIPADVSEDSPIVSVPDFEEEMVSGQTWTTTTSLQMSQEMASSWKNTPVKQIRPFSGPPNKSLRDIY